MQKTIVILVLTLLSCKRENKEGASDRIYDAPREVSLSGMASNFNLVDSLGYVVDYSFSVDYVNDTIYM